MPIHVDEDPAKRLSRLRLTLHVEGDHLPEHVAVGGMMPDRSERAGATCPRFVGSSNGRARARRVAAVSVVAMLLSSPLRAQGSSAPVRAESVSISVPDGSVLHGVYRGTEGASSGVLHFPMCGPTGAEGWRPVADRLQAAGVSSLTVAEAGFGPNGAREARADAALAYLRSRLREGAPIAVTGGSCGVALALGAASRSAEPVRGVVVVSGPYSSDQLEHVRQTPTLAVFSGASAAEPPSPEWARALKRASAHPASRVEIWTPRAHGTDYFTVNPSFADQVAAWLIERLTDPSPH